MRFIYTLIRISLYIGLPWMAVYYSQFYFHIYFQQTLFAFVLFGWLIGICNVLSAYQKKLESEEVNVVDHYVMKKRDQVARNVFCLIVAVVGFGFVAFAYISQIPYFLGILLLIPVCIYEACTKYPLYVLILLAAFLVSLFMDFYSERSSQG